MLLLLFTLSGPAITHAHVELELDGFRAGWTDITKDLMVGERCSFGLPGMSPRDRVAGTGEFHFALNNSAFNSVGLEGAYSPDHANCRAGFEEGIRVRYWQMVNAEIFEEHVGTLDEIVPDPDPLAGTFLVNCTAVDFMDDLARASVSGLTVLEDVRDDEIFSALIATLPRQPDAIEVTNGPDTFPVALDKVENKTRVSAVLQDVCQSSLSLCYVKGRTLVYEPRSVRAGSSGVVDTFDRTMVGLTASRNRANRLNRVEVTAHPRDVDAAPTTVLYSLPAGNAISIPASTSVVLWTPYTDPNASGQAVGGLEIQTPDSGAGDYLFNEAENGSGTDLTPNIVATIAPFGNTAMVTYTNNGASGWLTVAKVRGKAIRDYAATLLQAEDVPSQVKAGLNILAFDAPYQSSIATAYEIAVYLVNLYKGASTQVQKLRFFCPNTDMTFAARLLRRTVSDRIAIGESLTGLATSRHYFINAVTLETDERNHLIVEWLLAPADQTDYWLLEIAGRSELDQTTRLGFGLVLGHTDIPHGDSVHQDVAFVDVAHTDTHTDSAHQDVAHGDGAGHGDVAHVDSHGDTAFTDVGHGDVAFVNVGHGDTAHVDAHTDIDFYDFNDAFEGHIDISFSDDHEDVAFVNDAHQDTAFVNDAHQDVAHDDDAHQDVAHNDNAGHTDTPHVNIAHGDVAHADVAHSDTEFVDIAHSDSVHGDINLWWLIALIPAALAWLAS